MVGVKVAGGRVAMSDLIRRLPPWWPLALLVYGFPLWWLLGISRVLPMILAVPMAYALWRARRIVLPSGFGWWMLFLVWIGLSAFALLADAPGAVPGWGYGRIIVYAYRLSWYLVCTIVLLWVANASRRVIPFEKLASILAWMFVITAAGGLLGVLVPTLELRSALELVLPRGLTSNSFVRSLIHPGVADVQMVLGRPEARPKAPFAFANSWGANLALSLPFFIVAWIRNGTRAHRVAAPFVLMVAAVPTVYSLNRGLWASLVLGVILVVVIQAAKGRPASLIAVASAVMVALAAVVVSPLGTIVQERFDNQHSNDRRAQLLEQSVTTTFEGSPVIGFGSTRDVQGSFASIAGGATPDCSACEVPPLGTQGHLWAVIFYFGFVGAAFFLVYFIQAGLASIRCRTIAEIVALCMLLFFALQMFVYDTLGMPLYMIMIAIGAAWRDQSRHRHSEHYLTRVTTARQMQEVIHEHRALVASGVVLGLVAGLAMAAASPVRHTARTSVMLAPSPSYLSGDIRGVSEPRESTIDTEAGLVMAEATLAAALGTRDREQTGLLRENIIVTAETNTKVLNIDVRDADPARAAERSAAVARAYLDSRSAYLQQRREQSLDQLRTRRHDLNLLAVDDFGLGVEERLAINQAINRVVLTPTSAGEILRASAPRALPRQYSLKGATGAALGLLLAVGLIAHRLSDRHRHERVGHRG